VIIVWGAVFGALIFGVLTLTKQLRMPEEVEVLGLAYAEVGPTGYRLKEKYVAPISLANSQPDDKQPEAKSLDSKEYI
jgi:hypothetical protein